MGGTSRSTRGVSAELCAPPQVTEAPAVSRVLDAPTSLDSIGFGALLGLPAAVLASALVVRLEPTVATSTVVGAFMLFWPVATWLLASGTRRVLVVLRRGCLLGAALWLGLAVAPPIDLSLAPKSDLGLVEALSGRLAEGMGWLSLAAFAALIVGQRVSTSAARRGEAAPVGAQDDSAPLQK